MSSSDRIAYVHSLGSYKAVSKPANSIPASLKPPTTEIPILGLCRSAFSEEFSDAGGFGWKAAKPDFDWTHLMSKKVSTTAQCFNCLGNMLRHLKAGIVKQTAALTCEQFCARADP